MSGKRLGLALGGGAVRGFAHVGVLQVLEREGITVDCVAGTSVGSLVGAALAAGFTSEQLVQLGLQFRWWNVARPVWPRVGFLSFKKLEQYLVDQIGDLTFSDLRIPCAAVAADLARGEQVVLREGSVARAVRASCSVPGLVTPVQWEDRLLVDGGITNNLPISVVRDLGADIVIAVGLSESPGKYPTGILSTAIASIETMLIHAGDDPGTADVFVPVAASGLTSLVRTSRAHELMSLGRQATEAALPAIRALLEGIAPTSQ